MAGMISLARSPEDLKKDSSYGTVMPMKEPDQPVYPYGMCFCLDDETIQKISLDCDCEVGDEITMVVRFEVTSVSQNKSMNGPKNRLELQAIAVKVADEPGMMADSDERKSSRYGKGSSD
jgi:hypothetical protein